MIVKHFVFTEIYWVGNALFITHDPNEDRINLYKILRNSISNKQHKKMHCLLKFLESKLYPYIA